MVATGLDVNGLLHQHAPLEAQLQAPLNIDPAGNKSESRCLPFSSILTLISYGKSEAIYGNV